MLRATAKPAMQGESQKPIPGHANRRAWPNGVRGAVLLGCALAVLLPSAVAQKVQKPSNAECLACHSDSSLFKEVDGKKVALAVDAARFQASVHGSLDLSCTDCHADVQAAPHEPPPQKVNCGTCHEEEQQKYARSIHAAGIRLGKGGATCLECHGNAHEIAPAGDPASRVLHANVPATCAQCHAVQFTMERSGVSLQPVVLYRESVHGKAIASGNVKAAACTDCHDSHEVLPAGNPKSRIFKFNVPQTCGRCHQEVSQEFMTSIHGQALQQGKWQAPACTDCHGIHSIKKHIDPTSSVAAQNLARTACVQCHEGVRLSQEFGPPDRRVSTYLDSYHGLASSLGSKVVANCASCHGVHNILPSADPRSTIHRTNVVKTCGQCHPGASQNFALSKVHLSAVSDDIGSLGTLWVRRFYLSLIFLTIGGMVAHNFILWRRKALLRRAAHPRPIQRMNRNQRIQHWLLLTSFFALAATGFALKYPDSWLAWLLGSNETVRRLGHRVAGVVMVVLGFYHVGYMLGTREGRQGLRDFQPLRKDLTDLLGTLRYHLGLTPEKPQFGRFSYAEKAEYYAVVWGSVLMAVTGLMMWFEVEVTRWLARWSVDIATAIHFYEAVLAVSAIFVWHFYQVIFDPDVYPLNWAFWDGGVSEEHYREHHGLACEALAAAPDQAPAPPERQSEDKALPSGDKPAPD